MSASTTMILGDPRLRRDLTRSVGRRVHAYDVDDVVQTTLAEALGAKALPSGPEDVRRFVFAIARQKVADVHRRRGREARCVWPDVEAHAPAPSNDVKRWLERTLPASAEAQRTFDWILREAEGETLAEIAANDNVSPAMVRQRVSRLRRWLRTRWLKDVTSVTILAVVAISIAFGLSSRRGPPPEISREVTAPSSSPLPPAPPEPEPALLLRRPTKEVPLQRPNTRAPPPPSSSPDVPDKPRASVRTWWEKRPLGNGEYASKAMSEVVMQSPTALGVRKCATPSSRAGVGQVAVRFEPMGTVSNVDVEGPFSAAEIDCIKGIYAYVRSVPFKGDATVARDFITLVPEVPPVWATP